MLAVRGYQEYRTILTASWLITAKTSHYTQTAPDKAGAECVEPYKRLPQAGIATGAHVGDTSRNHGT